MNASSSRLDQVDRHIDRLYQNQVYFDRVNVNRVYLHLCVIFVVCVVRGCSGSAEEVKVASYSCRC